MAKAAKSARRSAPTRPISASGEMPSASAFSMIGVPWVSSAQTYMTAWPASFIVRTQMSHWIVSVMWPRWVGPFA